MPDTLYAKPARAFSRPAAAPLIEPVKAPWIRPGVVVHEPATPIDGLLAEFALTLQGRGFNIAGFVQRNNLGAAEPGHGCAATIELYDLHDGATLTLERHADDGVAAAAKSLRRAMREDADLVVISRYAAFETAARGLRMAVGEGLSQGMPILTSMGGRCVGSWPGLAEWNATMIAPEIGLLWQWWGPERLYRDLALGVADQDIARIACGPRWLMVETPTGAGLAYLPRNPKDLLPRLATLQRQGLRHAASLSQSWDPLEMALGIAAINANYNRFDLEARPGNGTGHFRHSQGRVVVVGSFPGLSEILPQSVVIETDPRPGEFPVVAMDSLLPGCTATVVNSSTLINRSLPRILRLTTGSRVALIGPSTPLTPRLNTYGVEVLGGLIVSDTDGLAAAIRAGALPREFGRFGRYQHIAA